MLFAKYFDYRALLAGAVVALAMTSCNSTKEVLYFQDAVADRTEAIVAAQNVKVEPGDEIMVYVTCEDPEATAMFNLLTETRRVTKPTSVKSPGVTNGGNNTFLPYTVSPFGTIDFPVVGEIKVGGLTRKEIADKIKSELASNNLVYNAVVTVEFANLAFTVLGEVKSAGAYSLDRDRLTLLEAIGLAGDLTIYGKRDGVWVIREEDGQRKMIKVDLRSMDFLKSPAYYVQQNDVIYVEPNSTRTGQSSLNENTFKSVGFWTSLVSVAISVATLVVTLSK